MGSEFVLYIYYGYLEARSLSHVRAAGHGRLAMKILASQNPTAHLTHRETFIKDTYHQRRLSGHISSSSAYNFSSNSVLAFPT
jgi:hypothetical protein